MSDIEIVGVVWEALAKADRPQTAEGVVSATGLDAGDVRKALARLREGQLLESVANGSRFAYRIQNSLDAVRWARAVDFGVPIKVLERHARLPSAEREKALRVASEGKIELLERQRTARKRQERHRAIEERALARVANTDLARLVSDTKAAAAQQAARSGRKASNLDRSVKAVLDEAARAGDAAFKTLLDRAR